MRKGIAVFVLTGLLAAAGILQPSSAPAAAPSAPALWDKANNFYFKKNWDSAAFYYNKIVTAGSADAAVYYNLGNVYYKMGRTGAAILNYERALLRKPDYKAAAENLELAETRIPERLQPPEDIFFVRWWQAMTSPGTSTTWAVIAVVLFITALALLWRRRYKASIPVQLVVAAFLLWGLCLAMAFASAGGAAGTKAVVMKPKAVLKTADGKSIAGVPEGTVVTQKSTLAGSMEVVLPDGRSGWLSQREVAAVD